MRDTNWQTKLCAHRAFDMPPPPSPRSAVMFQHFDNPHRIIVYAYVAYILRIYSVLIVRAQEVFDGFHKFAFGIILRASKHTSTTMAKNNADCWFTKNLCRIEMISCGGGKYKKNVSSAKWMYIYHINRLLRFDGRIKKKLWKAL